MDDTARAAFVISQAVCAMAEIAGMTAENQQRLSLGQSVAYGQEAFDQVTRSYQIGHNSVIEFLRGGA